MQVYQSSVTYVKLTNASEEHLPWVPENQPVDYHKSTVVYPDSIVESDFNGIHLAPSKDAAQWLVTMRPDKSIHRMAFVRRVQRIYKPVNKLLDATLRVTGVVLDDERIPVRTFFSLETMVAAVRINPLVILTLTPDEVKTHISMSLLRHTVVREPVLLGLLNDTIVDYIEDIQSLIPSIEQNKRHMLPAQYQRIELYLTGGKCIPWSVFSREDQDKLADELTRSGTGLVGCLPESMCTPKRVRSFLMAKPSLHTLDVNVQCSVLSREDVRICIVEFGLVPSGHLPVQWWDQTLLHTALLRRQYIKKLPLGLMTTHLWKMFYEYDNMPYNVVPENMKDDELDLLAVQRDALNIEWVPVSRHNLDLICAAVKRQTLDVLRHCVDAQLLQSSKVAQALIRLRMDPYLFGCPVSTTLDAAMAAKGLEVPVERQTLDVKLHMLRFNPSVFEQFTASEREFLYADYVDAKSKEDTAWQEFVDYIEDEEL